VELSVSQLGDALQVLLERKMEGLLGRRKLLRLAEKLLEGLQLTQERNRRSRVSHRRRRVKELAQKGICSSQLPFCDAT
jgi:phosphoserine phosphatase